MSKDRGETRHDHDDTRDNNATASVDNDDDVLGLLSATPMKSNLGECSISVLEEIDTWFALEDVHTNIGEGVSPSHPAASASVGQSSSSFTHDNSTGNGGSNEKKKMFAAFRSRRSLSHLAKSKTTTLSASSSSSSLLLDEYLTSNSDNITVPNPLAKSNNSMQQQQKTLVSNPILDSQLVPNPILVVDQQQTNDLVVTAGIRNDSIVVAQQPVMPSTSVITENSPGGELKQKSPPPPAVEESMIVPNPLLIPHEEQKQIRTCAESSFVKSSSNNSSSSSSKSKTKKGNPSTVHVSTTALYEVVDRLFADANKNTVTVKDIVQSVANYFHLPKVHKSMKRLIKTRLTDLMVQSKVVIRCKNDNDINNNLQNDIVDDGGREELIEQSLTNYTIGVEDGVDVRNSSSSSSSDLGTSKEDTELTITPVTLPAISAAPRKSRWGPRVVSIINGNDSNQHIDTSTTSATNDISCISEINNHIDHDEVDHDENNKNSNEEKNDNTNVAKYKHRPSSFKNADEALCALKRIREARAAARVVVDLSQDDDSTTIDESRSVVAKSAEKNGNNNNNNDGGDDNDQGAIDDALTLWLGTDLFLNDDVDYQVGGDDSQQESTVMLRSNRHQEEETDGNNKSTTTAEYDIESHTMNAHDMDDFFAKVAEKDDLASVATESTGISGGTAIDSLMAMSPPLFIDGDEFDSPIKFNHDLHLEENEAMTSEPSSENVPEKNGTITTESRSQENEAVTMKPSTKMPEESEANTLESSSKLMEESERNISESSSKVPEVSEASTSESSTKMSEESKGNTSESSSKLPEESEANALELSSKIPEVSEASKSESSNKMPEESDANTLESIGEISDAIEISESRLPESIGAMDNSSSVVVSSAVEFNEGANDKNEALTTASLPSNDNIPIEKIAVTSFEPSRNEEMNDVDEEIDEEQIRDFCTMLDRLGSPPDEVAINNLSMVAEDFSSSVESASTIYFSIHDLLVDRTSPGISNPDRKLPLVYVIDSLLKNVKGVYSDIICDDAANWMSTVYDIFDKANMDDEKASLREIWNTWRELDLIKDEKWREIGKCFLEAKGLSMTRARTEDKVSVGDAAEWNKTPTNAKSSDVQSGDDVAFSDVFVTHVEEVMIPQTSRLPPKKRGRPPKKPSSMERDTGCRTDERNETRKNAVIPAAGADCDDDIPLDLLKQKKNDDGEADAVEEMNCASPRSTARPTQKKRGKALKMPTSSKEVVGDEVNRRVTVRKRTAPPVEESGIDNDSPPEKHARTSKDDDKVDAADETIIPAPIPPTKRLVRPPKKPSTKVVAKAGKQDETPKDASVSTTEDVFDNDIRLQQRSEVKSVNKNIAVVKDKETIHLPIKPASKLNQKKRGKASKKPSSSEEVVGGTVDTRAAVQKRTARSVAEINIDNDSPPEQHVRVSNDEVVAFNALDEEISPAPMLPSKKRGRPPKKPSLNKKIAGRRAGEQVITAIPVAGEDFDDDMPLDQLKQKYNNNGEDDAIEKAIRASPKLPPKRLGRQSKKLTPRGEVASDEVDKEDMASRGREVVIASNEERGGETSVANIAKSNRRSCEESPSSGGGKGVITLSKSDQCAGTLKLGVTAMPATTTMTTPVNSDTIRLARVTVVTDVEIAVTPNTTYTLHAMTMLGRIKKEKAAISIQRITRGIFGRNIYRRMIKELWAAILVQRAVRGHSGRCTSYQKRMERGAQINIARMMRGLFERRRFLDVCKKRECAATKIECLWRKHAAIVLRSAHRRQMEASTMIQKSAARAGRCTVVTDVEIAKRPARQPRLNGNPTLPETINVPLAVAKETEMPSGRPQKIPVHLSTNEAVDVSFVSASIDAISHIMPGEMVDKDKNHHSTKRVRDETVQLPADEFPIGWVVRQRPRETQKNEGVPRVDLFWYSPIENYRFRSRVEVRRFLELLDILDGDEMAAMKKFKVS